MSKLRDKLQDKSSGSEDNNGALTIMLWNEKKSTRTKPGFRYIQF